MNLVELDALVAGLEMPVRPETLDEAWEMTEDLERSRHVVVMVTMHARPGMEGRLESAAREFVAAMSGRAGSLGATLHQSPEDPRTWFMIERFATAASFARHMASDHLARFQTLQSRLLVEPVTAVFLERGI